MVGFGEPGATTWKERGSDRHEKALPTADTVQQGDTLKLDNLKMQNNLAPVKQPEQRENKPPEGDAIFDRAPVGGQARQGQQPGQGRSLVLRPYRHGRRQEKAPPVKRFHSIYKKRIQFTSDRAVKFKVHDNMQPRGNIESFSGSSRLGLKRALAEVRWEELTRRYGKGYFLSLTWHDGWSEENLVRHRAAFLEATRRRCPDRAYLWVMELQERGAPHLHVLLFMHGDRVENRAWIRSTWHRIADPESKPHEQYGAHVEDAHTLETLSNYLLKYLVKGNADAGFRGKRWHTSKNLPRSPYVEGTMSEDVFDIARRIARKVIKSNSQKAARTAERAARKAGREADGKARREGRKVYRSYYAKYCSTADTFSAFMSLAESMRLISWSIGHNEELKRSKRAEQLEAERLKSEAVSPGQAVAASGKKGSGHRNGEYSGSKRIGDHAKKESAGRCLSTAETGGAGLHTGRGGGVF